jgi:hypothetical protein
MQRIGGESSISERTTPVNKEQKLTLIQSSNFYIQIKSFQSTSVIDARIQLDDNRTEKKKA